MRKQLPTFAYKAALLLASLWLWTAIAQLQGQAAALVLHPASEASLSPEDATILAEKLLLAQRSGNSLAERVLAVAHSFRGAPYGTLAKGSEEYLVLDARLLDCWTFVELSVAIALAAQQLNADPLTVADYVHQLRYWGGTIDGYASRVHYLSGWLRQGQDLGYWNDITRELGGRPFRKDICYMSTHPELYPPLKNPETLRRIRQVETRLSRRIHYYIPQQDIEQVESQIQDGDIIAITSSKAGLDFAHLGFATRQNGRVHLLHASSLQKCVVVSAQPIGAYVRAQKGQSGIAVIRLTGR